MNYIYLVRFKDEDKDRFKDAEKQLKNCEVYDLPCINIYSAWIVAAKDDQDAKDVIRESVDIDEYTYRESLGWDKKYFETNIDLYLTVYRLGTAFDYIKRGVIYLVDADYEQGLECGKLFSKEE